MFSLLPGLALLLQFSSLSLIATIQTSISQVHLSWLAWLNLTASEQTFASPVQRLTPALLTLTPSRQPLSLSLFPMLVFYSRPPLLSP